LVEKEKENEEAQPPPASSFFRKLKPTNPLINPKEYKNEKSK